jgi:Zn-dependent metalloprotease
MIPKYMNKSAIIVLFFAMIFCACNEQNTPSEADKTELIQINRIYDTQNQLISDYAMNIARNLFQKNGLSLSNLQVWRLNSDNLGHHAVKCYQFYQGLKFYTEDIIFQFDSQDIYYNLSGELFESINIDTIPKIAICDAVTLFYKEIAADNWYKDSLSYFCRQGFNAELGIFNLNSGIGNASKDFVLTWKTTVAGGWKCPVGYIRADSLRLIRYANGVIIN